MRDLLALLGAPGVALVVSWIGLVGYWATRPFRPEATWYSDLAQIQGHIARRHHRRRSRPDRVAMPHGLWPRAEVGPRMWRWPLNTTRWFCGRLWLLFAFRRGFLGIIGRTAWYPSAGLGAAAAMLQALVLMTLITLPCVLLAGLVDSTTVLRGGLPPNWRSHAGKTQAVHKHHARAHEEATAPVHTAAAKHNVSDWDRALAELLDGETPTERTEHGIVLGSDGQALDPAQQHTLDQCRHAATSQQADHRLDRIEQILDREERLADRADQRRNGGQQ